MSGRSEVVCSMEEKELMKLLTYGETETIEFKEQPTEHFYKTISALANTKGGRILLGVNKTCNIVGVESTSNFLEEMTNRIVNKLSIYPEIETIDLKGKRVIVVKVPRSGYPVSYEGRYYERVGNTTREISQTKLKALLLRGRSWDSLTGDFSLDEIAHESVAGFVSMAVKGKRLTDLSLNDSTSAILSKLGLMVDEKLTNGAILLFGKNPQKHFVNLCVRIGRFKTETTIIDDQWAIGNLFQQFEETINVLKQFISVRYEITDLQRVDVWDYPIPALREAVLNALIHRDYFNIANFILIKVYDDRIWFSNPGGLPEGISIEELKKPHSSFLRNPLLARVFYLAGFIEQYGSGTVRMVEWMTEAGMPEPDYIEELGGFSVYFYQDIYTEEKLRGIGLNERQIRAVRYVKEKGKITNKEYQGIADVSKPTASRELAELVDLHLLKQHGITGKGTFYELQKGSQRAQTAHKGRTKGSNEERG
jgi:ATP-dependent DNA helicase RecG